jgi:integrase
VAVGDSAIDVVSWRLKMFFGDGPTHSGIPGAGAARGFYQDEDLVFADLTGGPLNPSNLTRRDFKAILRRAKLPLELRWYDLRHTCATLLLSAGENVRVVAERLGHAKTALTLDLYAHVLPGMQEQATQRLEGMLFSTPR